MDAQAATGGVRINFIPRDGGNRFSGTIAASYATESFASDNFTGSDVQQHGLAVPGTIKGNGDFNPGFGGPIKRDKLWFFLSGRKLFADNYVAEHVLQREREQHQPLRLRAVDRTQAVLHQEQSIFQARFTWQANPKNKIGVTFDQESFCACTTGIGPQPGGTIVSPEAGNDRRFPLQRFVTVDWNTPVSNRLLVEASGIHRVERWGGMDPQVGKLGNIDHLTPGMISVTDSLNPVTGGPLTYRAAATYNNSWNWNIHYRAAVSYITGSNTFKVGFNNAYGHHENTTYSSPADALQLQLHLDGAERDRLPHRAANGGSERQSRSGAVRAGQVDDRPMDAGGRDPARLLQEQLPRAGDRRHVLRTESERPVRRDRQSELERRHARGWARPTTCSATARRR